MARSSISALDPAGPDIDAVDLRRLLIRLEQQILVPGPESPVHSLFERNKTAQNVEHARTLLLRLEHNTQNVKTQQRKHSQQSELARHRQLIKRLTERLYELNRRDDNGAELEPKEEDLIGEYFATEPTVQKAAHSRGPSSSSLPATTSEGLRSRNIQPAGALGTTSPTKGASTSRANELFAHGSSPMKAGFAPADVSSEKQLEHQDSIQADLTSLLVQQAQKLKLGSLEFQQSLAEDEEIRARAETAISKSASSMDVASRSMGALRRMSEGRWWWQRYIMFIVIFFLWFVQLAIVFISPKLRF